MTQIEVAELIRIAPGHIGATALLGDSNYLVSNFPIQDDSIYPHWLIWMDGGIRDGAIIQSLGGSGGKFGKLSGTLTMALFTPDMQDYFYTTIMQSKSLAPVTIYTFHPRYKFVVIQCYLRWFENIADNGTQQTDTEWTNISMTWNRGTITGNAFSSGFSEGFS